MYGDVTRSLSCLYRSTYPKVISNTQEYLGSISGLITPFDAVFTDFFTFSALPCKPQSVILSIWLYPPEKTLGGFGLVFPTRMQRRLHGITSETPTLILDCRTWLRLDSSVDHGSLDNGQYGE